MPKVGMETVRRKALVDAAQALTLEELPRFLEDCAIVREAYLKRIGR